MPSEIAQAYVQIIPTTENISQSLATAFSGSETAGDEAGEKAGSSWGKKAAAAVAVGAAAVTTAAVAVWNTASNTAAALDEIDKSSQKMGVSAEQYQAMAFAAEHCGFETSNFQKAVNQLQSSGYEGTIYDYMNALMDIEDPAERMAAAQEMLGERTANQMAAFINGGDSLEDYMNQLDDLGGLMSGDAVKSGAAFEDTLTDLKTSFSGVTNGLMAQLIPVLTDIMAWVTANMPTIQAALSNVFTFIQGAITAISTWFTENQESISGFVSGISEVLTTVGSAVVTLVTTLIGIFGELVTEAQTDGTFLNTVWEGIQTVIDGVVTVITSLLTGFTALLQGDWEGVFTAIQTITETVLNTISSVFSGILSSIGTIVSSAWTTIKTTWMLGFNAIKTTAQTTLNNIVQFFLNIPTQISSIITSVTTIGSNIVQGLWNGISNMATWIANNIRNFCSNALGAIKDFFGISSPSRVMADQVGKWIPAGIAEGISDNAGIVDDAMDDLMSDTTANANATLTARTNGSMSSGLASGSATYGTVTINVYGAQGQSVDELADKVVDKLNATYRRRSVAWAR